MLFGCPFGPSDIERDYPPKEMDVVELKLSGFDQLAAYRRNKSLVKDKLKNKKTIVHAPHQFDLTASTPDGRKGTLHLYEQCVDLCSMFDADILVVHPSGWSTEGIEYAGESTREQVLQYAREQIPLLIDYAKSSNVTVALENLPAIPEQEPKCIGYHADEFASLIREFGCRMCFDITHGMHDIDGFLAHKDLFSHMHLNDSHVGRVEHLFLGDGDIDWNKYAPQLLALDLPSIFEFDRDIYSDDDFLRGKEFMLQASQAQRQQ